MKFVLQNCGNNLPRVVGSSVLVPSTLTVVPNAAGNLSGTVVGNDLIECGTTIGQTYYQVTIYSGTQQVYQNNYLITGAAWNLSTANPLSNDPTAFLNCWEISFMVPDGSAFTVFGSPSEALKIVESQLCYAVETLYQFLGRGKCDHQTPRL